MCTASILQLKDREVLEQLNSAISSERGSTVRVIALIAEADVRRLYLGAGYPSMHAYCLGVLHLCEDSAFRRIHVARTVRKFPELLPALAEGQLNLTAVGLLAAHLTPENFGELVASATHCSTAEIRRLLAERAPRLELSTGVHPLEASPTGGRNHAQHAPEHVSFGSPKHIAAVEPIAPKKFELNLVIDESTHDLLRYAQELEGSQAKGHESQVLHRALAAYVAQLEKRRFAKTDRPRTDGKPVDARGRHVPAAVKRAVWKRDGRQCTLTCDDGHRCSSRTDLELDHVLPYALGGQATVENLRLRCRAHNRFTAERELGADFVVKKREEAREQRVARAGEKLARLEGEADTVSAESAGARLRS